MEGVSVNEVRVRECGCVRVVVGGLPDFRMCELTKAVSESV